MEWAECQAWECSFFYFSFSLQNILLPEVILNNIPITTKNHSFNIKKYIVINIPIIVRIKNDIFLLDKIINHLLPIKTNADTVTTIIVYIIENLRRFDVSTALNA